MSTRCALDVSVPHFLHPHPQPPPPFPPPTKVCHAGQCSWLLKQLVDGSWWPRALHQLSVNLQALCRWMLLLAAACRD